MALTLWAIDVPRIPRQRDAKFCNLANLYKWTVYGLQPETRLHEKGITSNRVSLCHGGFNLSQVLTTRQAPKGNYAINLGSISL